MISYFYAVMALWVLTHVITQELPTRNLPKPWSCPLCFSGWACIAAAGYMYYVHQWDPGLALMIAFGIWAGVLILDAIYWRLRTTIL